MRDVFINYEHVETLHLQTEQREKTFIIFKSGRKIEVKSVGYHCGGGAVNSAISFARQGFSTRAFFKIGADQEGDFIVKKLNDENISTDAVATTKKVSTGTSFIIPGFKKNNSILVYRGANLTITQKEIPENAIAQSDYVYITSLSGSAAKLLAPITAMAKKHKKIVAANPGTSQLQAGPIMLKKALGNIDILILNSYESQLLMTSLTTFLPEFQTPQINKGKVPKLLKKPLGGSLACFTLPQFFREVHSHGPKIVVVTNGADGVYVSDGTTIYFHSSIKTKTVSTIGAGDAFGSCFIGQLALKKSLEKALCAGIVNSASVIGHANAQDGLLTTKELEKRCSTIKQQIKKFPL